MPFVGAVLRRLGYIDAKSAAIKATCDSIVCSKFTICGIYRKFSQKRKRVSV